jgi:glutaredoxin
VEYIDVVNDAEQLATMLGYSDGRRQVPVIVDGDEVSVGFKGKA